MASVAQSIDELFRQKSLQEIHAELRSTREEVEVKKRELRDLVGDHYRSVLESSDHIRVMSDCASKVSIGADRIDELIASMRTLAANPPPFVAPTATVSPTSASPTSPASAGGAVADEDSDFLVGKSVMELIEIPETVREHLGEFEFVRAARVALVDAVALREKVDALLQAPGRTPEPSGPGKFPAFDYATLVGQQTATFRGLPRQIGASCLDAFAATPLRPAGAAQGFVVHLLLEPSAQPVPLLSSFLDRRVELLRGLLDSPVDSGPALGSGGHALRLAEAAKAFEGTVLLSSCLCRSTASGGNAQLIATLDAVVASTGDGSAAEERAAIEGRTLDTGGVGALRRRAGALRAQLEQGGVAAMAAQLAEVGGALAQEWSPQRTGAAGLGDAAGRALRARFARLVAAAVAGGQLSSCQALSEVLAVCKERVLAYREELTGGPPEAWGLAWREACGQFCPGRADPLDDALAIVSSTIEKACAGIVGERVADLRLQLVLEEDGSTATAAAARGASGGVAAALADGAEGRRREEIAEFQRQARSAVSSYDERLGEVMTDAAHIARSGEAPAAVSRALLAALQGRLQEACEQVPLPDAPARWPRARAAEAEASGTRVPPWQLQRSAARAAIAMDALLSVASDSKGVGDVGKSNLHQTLDAALSSGVPDMAAQAQAIVNNLRQNSSKAYCVWARLGVLPVECAATLTSFWRLADDEVAPACGWGSARFAPKAGDDATKAVPIPVQASPFVTERVALGARQAAEVSSSTGSMPHALVTAVKVALSELFMSAYDAETLDLEAIKRAGMSHLLQLLFDLRFLRITLAAGPPPGAGHGAKVENSAAYEALRELLERAEAATLLDPVDRLLYQETLKSSVKSHIEGVKVLLAPFFLYNPLYGFLLQPSTTRAHQDAAGLGSDEAAGFEIQAAMAAPLRPVLPRFPLLPVAMASTLAYTSSTDLDARLGLSAAAMDRAAARAAAASGGAGAPGSGLGWMRDASSLVGSGLGSLGIGKALGGNWTTGLGFQGGSTKPPEAV